LGVETPKTLPDTLHFVNAGSLDLTIHIQDLHPSPVFTFTPADSFVVPKNGGTFDAFSATFNPPSFGCYDDTVVFYSLQPAQSDTVCFHGCAFTKGLQWYPASVTDLGEVLVSDSDCTTGYITNTGSTPDTLNSITGTSATFTASFQGTFPLILQPGDTLHIIFCYHPQQIGTDTAQITFVAQSGISPVFRLKGTGFSIGQTCVSLVPPPRILTQQLGTPVAVNINLLNSIDNSPTYSFRATVKYDPSRLQFDHVQPSAITPAGWTVSNTVVQNGEVTFTLSGASPIQGTGYIAAIVFEPYYGSALSTLVTFDTNQLSGFKFNIQSGQDSTNPIITCALDTAVVTFDSICGLTLSNIVFNQGTYLYQNAPNPVDASVTNVQFQTGTNGFVQLLLFNQFGVQVKQLVNGSLGAGYHSVDVDTRTLPAGSYFYELIAPDRTIVRRMVVIK
jgi:hypothetical protein